MTAKRVAAVRAIGTPAGALRAGSPTAAAGRARDAGAAAALRDPPADRLGDPRRHGVGRRGVAAVASRDGAFDDVDVEGAVALVGDGGALRPPRRARGRSGPSRARRGRRPRTADQSPRVLCAGRSRASGHTSQWRAGAGATLRTRLPIGTGRGRAGSRSIPIQGSGPATTSLSTRAGSGTHGSGVTCCTRGGRRRPTAPGRQPAGRPGYSSAAVRREPAGSEHGLIPGRVLSGRPEPARVDRVVFAGRRLRAHWDEPERSVRANMAMFVQDAAQRRLGLRLAAARSRAAASSPFRSWSIHSS